MLFDSITPERLLLTAILIGIFLLVAFPVHEFAHAAAAFLLGDHTAKLFGRLTLNPIAHFDPLGGMLLVVSALASGFLFGWAKPTPVNPANLRDRRNGEVIVALAGPLSNLVMASLGAFLFRLFDFSGAEFIGLIVYLFVLFNIALAIFNLIPIPPLDGSTLLFRVLDPRTAMQLRPVLSQYGFIILLIGIFVFSRPLTGLIQGVANVLVGR